MSCPNSLEERTWFAVVRTYQLCTRRYEQMLAGLELTASQYDALSAIQRLGGDAQPKRIADQLLVSRGNVTGLLERMKTRGLIRIGPHPEDGRARIAHLTPSGRTLVERVRPLARAFIQAQMAPFDSGELGYTRHIMERMERHLDQLDPETLIDESAAAHADRAIEQEPHP